MLCPNHVTCDNRAHCTELCPVVDHFGSTLLVATGTCDTCPRKVVFAGHAICACPQRLDLYLAARA